MEESKNRNTGKNYQLNHKELRNTQFKVDDKNE